MGTIRRTSDPRQTAKSWGAGSVEWNDARKYECGTPELVNDDYKSGHWKYPPQGGATKKGRPGVNGLGDARVLDLTEIALNEFIPKKRGI